MPKDSTTPVGQGPGSITPSFTAPQVGVATPGRQLQPQRTEAEDFRDAIIAAGRGVGAAVSARASINTRIKALKETSMAKVEADLNRAARGAQAKRLATADRRRQQILVDAEEKGVEWAEREFRSRMTNASSTQEARLWEGAWQNAAGQVSRENEQARRQSFNSAKMTMQEVGLALNEQLAEDTELRTKLTGDGNGIGGRVQDWMLQEIQQSVNLDALTEEDAELLIHQAIVQSAGIADKLRGSHQAAAEKANLQLGMRQMTSDIISTASGEQDPVHLREQIEVTLRDNLSHMTLEQQASYVRESLASSLTNIANGSLGIDAADSIENAKELLNLTVHGQKVFTQTERQALAIQLANAGQRTIANEANAAVSKLKEATRTPVTATDGSVSSVPNKAAELALLVKGDDGRDAFDREADRILAEQGLLNLEKPSPEQSLLTAQVRQVMDQQRRGSAGELARNAQNEANWVSVMTGNSGDGDKAYIHNPFTRAKMTTAELAANKTSGLGASDITFVRTALQKVAVTDAERSAIANWSGQALDYTEENRDMHRLMAMSEARQWQEGEIQAVTGMPQKLVNEKLSLLKSNDPLRVEAFTNFATMLDNGAGEGWSNFLDAVSPNEAAAAQWMRQHGRLGQPGAEQPTSAAPLDLMDQAQTILNAPSVNQWLGSDTGTENAQARFTNTRNMAEVLTAIIEEENPDADFNDDGNMLAQLTNMILSDRNSTGRAIRQLWFAGRQVNATMEDAQVGGMIYQWMRKDGMRFRTVNDRVVIVSDPIGYTGEQGDDVTEFAEKQMIRPFTPQYRSFLMEAMGTTPGEVPFNLQHMLVSQNKELAAATDPFGDRVMRPIVNFRDQSSGRMLESRANYGGFVVGGQSPDGIIHDPIVSVNDATLTWADGTTVFVRKGTVLNVINPDLFAPRTQPRRPRLTGFGGPPTSFQFSRPVSRVSPTGAIRNIPQQ